MVRKTVISLHCQCCHLICRRGVAFVEYALQQLPVHLAPALLIAAIKAEKVVAGDAVSCIISNWPLPVLRYVHFNPLTHTVAISVRL